MKKRSATKKRNIRRRRTLRGGFRDVTDACDQIYAAANVSAAKKIWRKASLQFSVDKGGNSVDAAYLNNCIQSYEAKEPQPSPPSEAEKRQREAEQASRAAEAAGVEAVREDARRQAEEARRPPKVQIGIIPLGTDIDALDDDSLEVILTYIREYPQESLKTILKKQNAFILVAEPGATIKNIKAVMAAQDASVEDQKFALQEIKRIYDVEFPLDRRVVILIPSA